MDLCAQLPVCPWERPSTSSPAPLWMRRGGLEWDIPSRLRAGYLFGHARFLWGPARQAAGGGGTAGALATTGK